MKHDNGADITMTDEDIRKAAYLLGWVVHKDYSRLTGLCWLWELGEDKKHVPVNNPRDYREDPIIPVEVKERVLEAVECGTLPTDVPVCSCGATEGVSYDVDPFSWEVYENYTKYWLCEECREERRNDI